MLSGCCDVLAPSKWCKLAPLVFSPIICCSVIIPCSLSMARLMCPPSPPLFDRLFITEIANRSISRVSDPRVFSLIPAQFPVRPGLSPGTLASRIRTNTLPPDLPKRVFSANFPCRTSLPIRFLRHKTYPRYPTISRTLPFFPLPKSSC